MRTDVVLALVLLVASAVPARAQEQGHGATTKVENLSQLTPEQRRDAQLAYSRIVCRCPKENWSKTLAMCPDDCAAGQKFEVIARVQEGWSVDRIVAEQVATYGTKAAADPGAGDDGSLWILVLVAGGAVAASLVLLRWTRRAAQRRAEQRGAVPASDAETAAVERELSEIE